MTQIAKCSCGKSPARCFLTKLKTAARILEAKLDAKDPDSERLENTREGANEVGTVMQVMVQLVFTDLAFKVNSIPVQGETIEDENVRIDDAQMDEILSRFRPGKAQLN